MVYLTDSLRLGHTREKQNSTAAVTTQHSNDINATAQLLSFELRDPGRASHIVHPARQDRTSHRQIRIDWSTVKNHLSIDVVADYNLHELSTRLELPYRGYSLSVSLMKHKYWICIGQIKEGCDNVVSVPIPWPILRKTDHNKQDNGNDPRYQHRPVPSRCRYVLVSLLCCNLRAREWEI